MLNIENNMASKGHSQTDGQSENTIRTVCQMLHHVVQNRAKCWDLVQSELEYEYNSTKHESTGLTPIEVDLGCVPQSQLLKETTSASNFHATLNMPERRKMFQTIECDNLAVAKAQQEYYANEKRRHIAFEVGDLVMLNLAGSGLLYRADLPKKWRPKFVGSLAVKDAMGSVRYKFELPPTMKLAHNVFQVTKLKNYVRPEDDKTTLCVVIDADGNVEHEVKTILIRKSPGERSTTL